MTKILILCTGNSCRSQMAHGFLQSFDRNLEVYSAGTLPASRVNENAIKVMKEAGIDISGHVPADVAEYLGDDFDYVITVCDNAKETCPVFFGKVKHNIHIGFEDPSLFAGTKEKVLSNFREVRDQIEKEFRKFYEKELRKEK